VAGLPSLLASLELQPTGEGRSVAPNADPGPGVVFGGNEMQRNTISERLIGLPREPSLDRDLPFSEVVRNQRSIS
jgi:hypothetical protein